MCSSQDDLGAAGTRGGSGGMPGGPPPQRAQPSPPGEGSSTSRDDPPAEAPRGITRTSTLATPHLPAGPDYNDLFTSPGTEVVRASTGAALGAGGAKKQYPEVMEGPEFRARVLKPDGSVNLAEFRRVWRQLRVLARCSPSDKYVLVRAVRALKETGAREVIAMTGDGTNDAPALRIADVGFAMNSGTAIAKEASDILLLDNNMSSIVQAVKWGRNVYANITKFLQFQLTINVVAVTTACAGAAILQESPLTAVQMLWVNLIMDSLASLALATEPPTDGALDQPPYRADAPLLSPTIQKNIAVQTVYQLGVMWLLVFHGGWFGWPHDVQMCMVFNAFVQMQLFNQLNARKIAGEANVLGGLLGNRLFLGIVGAEAVLQALIVQFGGSAFQTVPLNAQQWGLCIAFGAASLLVRQASLALEPGQERQ